MKAPACNSNLLPRSQQGLTLVEVMVAVTLGLILTAGLIQVFVSNKQAYRVQEGLARLQENGRFAIDFITRDVRGAGFVGCPGSTTPIVNTLNNAGSLPWNFASPMQGFEAITSTTWSSTTASLPLDASIISALGGRDVITVRRSVGDPVPVVSQPAGAPPGSSPITVAVTAALSAFDTPANQIAMISDCTNAAVFQIRNPPNPSGGTMNHAIGGASPPAAPGNATDALGKDFTNTAEVVRLSTITYYVRQTGTASGRPALWRQVGGAAAQELVEGVQDMQIRYGVDTDGDQVPNQYLQANAVTDFNNVVSVRVDLLLQSIEDNLTNAPQPYTYNGLATTPADRRYRQVFSATIGLRNKIL